MAGSQQNAGLQYNSLTSGSKIIGTIVADGDIRVDGMIEGDVKCSSKLVVGERGCIKGSVECQNAEIMGKIEGKIDVANTLILRATSNVQGEVVVQTLNIEPNAMFNGTCTMKNGKAKNEK